MMKVEFTGLDSKSDFAKWIDSTTSSSNFSELLDELGRASKIETIKDIQQNKVKPSTSATTLLQRRTRKNKPSSSGTTLIDTGVGYRTISYQANVAQINVAVGVPNGYMWRHQKGEGVPERKFLRLLKERDMLKLVKVFWRTKR